MSCAPWVVTLRPWGVKEAKKWWMTKKGCLSFPKCLSSAIQTAIQTVQTAIQTAIFADCLWSISSRFRVDSQWQIGFCRFRSTIPILPIPLLRPGRALQTIATGAGLSGLSKFYSSFFLVALKVIRLILQCKNQRNHMDNSDTMHTIAYYHTISYYVRIIHISSIAYWCFRVLHLPSWMRCYQDELPALAKSAVVVSFQKDKAIIKQGDEGHDRDRLRTSLMTR